MKETLLNILKIIYKIIESIFIIVSTILQMKIFMNYRTIIYR